MPSILFVCTGNRCRSPLAAAIFWNRLGAWGRAEGWRVDSAGTWTQPGMPVDPFAQKAALEIGLDLQNHRTRPIDQVDLKEYDLVVVMEKSHTEALCVEFPACVGKIHLLTHLAGEIEDVPDPSEESLAFHRQVTHELVKLIDAAYEQICELTFV